VGDIRKLPRSALVGPSAAARIPPHWLEGQGLPRWNEIDHVPLAQFVLLSILLHALAIALFGAPGGGSREGRAMWGTLSVLLQPMRDAPQSAPADAPALKQSTTLTSRRPRTEPAVRTPPPAVPAPAPDPAAAAPGAVEAPIEAPPAISIPPLLDRIVTPETPAALVMPLPVEAPPAPPAPPPVEVTPPAQIPPPLERVVVPERKVELAPAPVLPPPVLPAPLEIPAVPIPALKPSPELKPLAETPMIAAPVAPPVPIEIPVAAIPLLRPSPALKPLAETPVIAAPIAAQPAPGIPAPVPAAPDIPAPTLPAAARTADPPAAAAPAPREAGRIEADPPGLAERGYRVPPVPESPSLFRTRPLKPAPSNDYDPTAPSLDADALRKRAGELGREGLGQRALLPFPMPPGAKPRSKLEAAIDNARKPDCRTAYSWLGLAAVVPLIANQIGEGNCRW